RAGATLMTRAVTMTVRVRIGDGDGPIVTVRGREAWALLALQASGERGCTPIDHPGPRWSGYVHDLRKLGFVIVTIHEADGGSFPGGECLDGPRSQIQKAEKPGGGGVSPPPATWKAVGEVLPSPAPLPHPEPRTITDGIAGDCKAKPLAHTGKSSFNFGRH